MSNQGFIIQRIGNKKNDIKFFLKYLPLNVETVVEPFGGSFAVIRKCYYEDKFKKIVNDNDADLFYVYTHVDELITAYDLWNEINAEDEFSRRKKEKLLNHPNIHNSIKTYIINSLVARGTLTKSKNTKNIEGQVELMKKINFHNIDAFELIDKHKGDDKAFIFCDPPYLFSDNSCYSKQNNENDCTDYYIKFLELLKDKNVKCHIMLIINDLKILRYLFKDYIITDYLRQYQLTKKSMKHLVITNY